MGAVTERVGLEVQGLAMLSWQISSVSAIRAATSGPTVGLAEDLLRPPTRKVAYVRSV
jgi:hypothetical protein